MEINIINLNNLNEICRACLTTMEFGIPILIQQSDEEPSVLEMLNFLAIELSNNEILPKAFCMSCYQQIQNAYQFTELFKKSQQQLDKLLEDRTEPLNKLNEYPELIPILEEEAEICEIDTKNRKITTIAEPEEIIITFTKETELKKNKKVKVNKKGFPSCPQCNTICKNTYNFRRHLGVHAKKNLCDSCKPNLSKSEYLKHSKQFVENQCNMCSKSLINKTIFKCNNMNCDKIFLSKYALYKHTKRIHESNLYLCNICGTSSQGYDNHRYHMLKHKSASHLCMYCGRAFFQAAHLRYHLWTHTGLRPYACRCGKRFVSSKLMNNHKKRNCRINGDNDENSGSSSVS